MRKQLNKIAMIALAGVIGSTGLAAFAGCADPYANMTQLSIHYFNGGLGSDWINESIAEFEEMFKDVSFESGKTGVKLLLTADKSFDEIATSLSTGADKADILYTAEGNAIVDLLNTDGILYDTTEMATEKVYNADGEVTLNAAGDGFEVVEGGQSMYDRMHPYFRDTYNLAGTEWATNSSDVSFTMLPYEDTLAGIILDYDLYEELYTKYYRAGLIGEMTGYKYEGDNVAMPGTWDEFFDFMTLIRDNESHSAGGYSGFMYSVDYYTPSIENAVIADVDGTDEGVTDPAQYSGIRMYDTYQGTYDFGGELGVQTITKDNAYLLTQTKGYRQMVEVAARLFEHGSKGGEHYDNGIMNNLSYSTAQANFVMSKISTTAPRILAIMEGDWFENEARATFNSMGAANAENAYGKRKFRMMPIPHATEEEVKEGKTYKVGGFSGGYPIILNAKTLTGNAGKEKVAKLWIQFTHSESQMNVFTKWSGSVRPYLYDVTEDTKQQMTPFAQSILELQMEDRAEDGAIEIVRKNKINQTSDVRNSASPVNMATKIDSGTYSGTFSNAAVIANMVGMRKANKSWTGESQIADVVEAYMNGLLSYRGAAPNALSTDAELKA